MMLTCFSIDEDLLGSNYFQESLASSGSDSNQLANNPYYMCFFASSKMDAALFSQVCVAVAMVRPFVAMDAALFGWDKRVSMMSGN